MTGDARLSSARVVRCMVKSNNERNPHPVLNFSRETALVNREEGGDDVKSACPLCLGRHTCYNGIDNELQARESKLISEMIPQFGLESETRLHEAGIASNRWSAIQR